MIFIKNWFLLPAMMFMVIAACSGNNGKPDETVLARVNDEVLTYQELMYQLPLDMQGAVSDSDMQQIVDNWINAEVLYQKAVAMGYEKEPDVKALIKSKSREIVAGKLVDSDITPKVYVSPATVDSIYNARKDSYKVQEAKYRVSHILVDDYESADALYKRLKNGSNFAALALDYSRDRQSAPSGGDIGYFSASQVEKPIADAVKNLQIGNFSKPVKTSYGYHILKLTDKVEAGSDIDSVQAKKMIYDRLFAQMHAAEFQNVVDSLRSAADIQIYPLPGAGQDVTQDGQ